MLKHLSLRSIGPALLLLCVLGPMVTAGVLVPLIEPTRTGLKLLLYFAGCGTSFLLLGWWEMRFVRADVHPVAPARGALFALLVLLCATGIALARLGAMDAIEATVLGLVGVVSGAFYLWLRK